MDRTFTINLLKWNKEKNDRQMPWKGIKDPYKIWLSEIILQQTRVEQGWSYYERFITEFPTIHDLANAPEEKVFKLWEGLGYYSRCKNLLHTAKYISTDLHGRFPSRYNDIILLKGIGPYTAAAISSFAFNEPKAVVDGNVQRVLSRYFGIHTPVDSPNGKKTYQQLAQDLLHKDEPGIYNQAIMDFGAVICKPQNPLCASCVQQATCEAYNKDLVRSLPVKEKRLVKKHRWFYYLVLEINGSVYLRKRPAKDIWENLFEFVLFEDKEPLKDFSEILPAKILGNRRYIVKKLSKVFRQVLSHQVIQGQFIVVQMDQEPALSPEYFLADKKYLTRYAFPGLINQFLKEDSSQQSLF
jgi:A/G-specific adenine glycosylase